MRIRRGTNRTPARAGHEKRARQFRARHSLGQRVTGRFVKWERPGLAWVSFDGINLLANLETEPAPGSRLNFTVTGLTPDIVLKELPKGGASPSGGPNFVQAFSLARSAFEAHSQAPIVGLDVSGMDEQARMEYFFEALDAKGRALYLIAAQAQCRVNGWLSGSGSARLHYRPWLLPQARSHEMVRRVAEKEDGDPFVELAAGFVLDSVGPVQIRLLARTPVARYRVWLEDPARVDTVRDLLDGLNLDGFGLDVDRLAVERAPKYAHGGVLSELLTASAHLIGAL